MQQQSQSIDENVALLALDELAAIKPVRINAVPPFSALKPIVENVPRRPRHLPPRHHQITLPIPLPTQSHQATPNH